MTQTEVRIIKKHLGDIAERGTDLISGTTRIVLGDRFLEAINDLRELLDKFEK